MDAAGHRRDAAQPTAGAVRSEADIDQRIRTMNKASPDAMVEAPPQGLQDQMQADLKDKHVLAGAVPSESAVLVTDNLNDFNPPTSGPNQMRVESLDQLLSRQLEEQPEKVQAGLQNMVGRYRREPRSMSALIDTMAEGQELRSFAQQLNQVVPPEQRGTSPASTGPQRGSAEYAAFAGVAEAGKLEAPTATPEGRKSGSAKGAERAKDTEQNK